MHFLESFGRYLLLIQKTLAKPEKGSFYYKQVIREIDSLGVSSVYIVMIISAFMGAVITLQTAYNIESSTVPDYLAGFTARDSMLLEFSSTMVGLILAGKVGSNIASEIGTMRVSEQIEALEIMGVNSASYLILPKIIATVIFNPILTLLSMVVGLVGGYVATIATGAISVTDYVYGIQYWFIPYYITTAIIKTVVYAFIIATVPAYHGYYTKGGALEVGKSSTRGVVTSSILILLFDLLLTQLLLA